MSTARLGAEQWSAYWRVGSVTTFHGIFTQNYDREVGEFWRAIFADATEGTHLVDLACGNGALALLAAEHSREAGKHFTIDALDFAEIQAPNSEAARALLEDIRFLPGRRLEDTQLDSDAYQLAVSQFGIEYGERSATIAELDRILAPSNASVVFMCHDRESHVLKQAQESLADYAACRESKAADISRKLQKHVDEALKAGRDPAKDRACEKLRARLNAATESLHDAAAKASNPENFHFFLKGCMAPFGATAMNRQSLAQRLAMLDALEQECDAFEARMADLLSAALDKDAMREWEEGLESVGFRKVRSEPVIMDDKLFAHAMVFQR